MLGAIFIKAFCCFIVQSNFHIIPFGIVRFRPSGSWRHRITSLFEFHKLIIIIGTQKVKRFFGKILGIEEGNRFSPVPLKIGLWPERHSRHLFCPLPKGVWRMGTLFPPQSPFLSYLKYSSIIPACKGFSCSSHSSSMWFHQFARRTRWSFDIQRGHSLPLPVESL